MVTSDPLVELPNDYLFDSAGLHRGEVWLSNYILRPTRAYARVDETLPFACDIVACREGQEFSVANHIELTSLSAAWWKTVPAGCFSSPSAKHPERHLQLIFQHLLGQLKPISIVQVDQLGWTVHPNGHHIYVTGAGVLGEDGLHADSQVWIDSSLHNWHLEVQITSKKAALDGFWSVFNELPGYSDVLMAFTLMTFLFPLYAEAGIGIGFPLILEGRTESKKTSLACALATFYNRQSDPRSSLATLTSTQRAIEQKASELRHGVLVVDDLFPDGGEGQRTKALNIIRNISNQITRQAKQGSTVRGEKMECGVIITAEEFPYSRKSSHTRCLRLPLGNAIPNEKMRRIQQDAAMLPDVFSMFIARVSSNYHIIEDKIADDFMQYRSQREKDGTMVKSERLAEEGFALYEAMIVFLTLFPREDAVQVLRDYSERIERLLAWQLSAAANPYNLDIISEIPKIHRARQEYFISSQGCWCIPPTILCGLIQQTYGVSLSEADLIAKLRDKHALLTDKSNAATKKIKGYARCLFLIPSRLR